MADIAKVITIIGSSPESFAKAADAAVQEAAGSAVPTLGYGVAYAVGTVLITLWGGVMIALLS